MTVKTVKVSKETHRRLTEAKPYDSLAYGEFIAELVDAFQGQEAEGGTP